MLYFKRLLLAFHCPLCKNHFLEFAAIPRAHARQLARINRFHVHFLLDELFSLLDRLSHMEEYFFLVSCLVLADVLFPLVHGRELCL